MKLPSTDEIAECAPAPDATLTELQNWMVELLRHKKGLDKSSKMRAAAALHFSGSDRLSPAEQIDIYRQQFWLRHTSILVDDFPGLSGLLGQELWEPVVESYLSKRAYNIFSLSDLGAKMPRHLEEYPNLQHRELCVDMARLECAYEEAFTAADDPQLSPEKLLSIPTDAWASAKFQTSHSLHLLQMRYPVAGLRRKIVTDPKGVNRKPLPDFLAENLVVYRRDRTLYDKVISRPAFLLLAELQKGIALVPACERVTAQEPSAADVFDRELGTWFGLWGRLGWISDVLIEKSPASV